MPNEKITVRLRRDALTKLREEMQFYRCDQKPVANFSAG